ALGGHCRALRRLEVGPFSVDDADDERILPAGDALPFFPILGVDAGEAAALRAGRGGGQEDTRTGCAGEVGGRGRAVLAAGTSPGRSQSWNGPRAPSGSARSTAAISAIGA